MRPFMTDAVIRKPSYPSTYWQYLNHPDLYVNLGLLAVVALVCGFFGLVFLLAPLGMAVLMFVWQYYNYRCMYPKLSKTFAEVVAEMEPVEKLPMVTIDYVLRVSGDGGVSVYDPDAIVPEVDVSPVSPNASVSPNTEPFSFTYDVPAESRARPLVSDLGLRADLSDLLTSLAREFDRDYDVPAIETAFFSAEMDVASMEEKEKSVVSGTESGSGCECGNPECPYRRVLGTNEFVWSPAAIDEGREITLTPAQYHRMNCEGDVCTCTSEGFKAAVAEAILDADDERTLSQIRARMRAGAEYPSPTPTPKPVVRKPLFSEPVEARLKYNPKKILLSGIDGLPHKAPSPAVVKHYGVMSSPSLIQAGTDASTATIIEVSKNDYLVALDDAKKRLHSKMLEVVMASYGELGEFKEPSPEFVLTKKKGPVQLNKVREVMSDGLWHPLSVISARTGYSESSVSARLRDLRKPQYGGHTVERRSAGKGLFEYRMV